MTRNSESGNLETDQELGAVSPGVTDVHGTIVTVSSARPTLVISKANMPDRSPRLRQKRGAWGC